MTAPLSQLDALVRFSVAQQLRGMRWYLGLASYLALLIGGFVFSDDRHAFLRIGLSISFVTMFSYGIAQDRASGFQDLIANFVDVRGYFACKIAVAWGLWLIFCVIAAMTSAALWREPRLALWGVTHGFLLLAFLIPIALIIETLIDLNYPAALALVICAAIALFNLQSDARGQHFFEVTGLDVSPSSFVSLSRLAFVVFVWNVVGVALATGLWHWQHRLPAVRRCR